MSKTVQDIIEFIYEWRENKGIPNDIKLENNQVITFVTELQNQIEQMDFSIPSDTTIIAYSGQVNGIPAHEVAEKISKLEGNGAFFISDLPAGTLLCDENRKNLLTALANVVGEKNASKILSGYDLDGNRVASGGCGFGDNLLSIDDFVCAKLMGETQGASSNIIVLAPEGIKIEGVFADTEIKQIFENDTFNTINGISKGQLQEIYNSGEIGKRAVYDILEKTSKSAVGNSINCDGAARNVLEAYRSGILNPESNSFTISACYDTNGNFIGIQLDEKGKGTIIEPPQGTVYKSEYTNTYTDEAKLAELFGEERYNNLSDYEKKQAADLSNKIDEFLNSTDSEGDKTSKSNTSSDADTKKTTTGTSDTTDDAGTKHTGTDDTDSSKTNTGESSDKTTGTNESSSGDNSDTQKTEGSDTSTSDAGSSKYGGDTDTSGDGKGTHTSSNDADIKDGNSSKYIPGESTSDKSTSSKKGRDVDLESESAKKYLGSTGKAADELDDIDKAMINIANKCAKDPDGVSDFAKSLGKYDDIIKAGSNTLGYVDAVCTAIYAIQAVYDASEAYEEGNTNTAIGIVAGAVAELVVSTVGAIAIASAISACLMAVGGIVAGPIGSIVIGLVSGVIAGWGGQGWNELIQSCFVDVDETSMVDVIVVDPLILDLNDDGIYTKQLEDGTHFDYADDGFAEMTGWVSEEDGLLVHDLNQNGMIDDGSELFGDMTLMSNGEISENGFQALADLDSNNDGIINSEDDAWSELQVWKDKNSDAVSQEDELYTLEELGIEQLNLKNRTQNTKDNGNLIMELGSYVTEDGVTHTMVDVKFAIDTSDTVQLEDIEVADDVKDLPNIKGSGRMGTLHQAMSKDETLKEMVKAFANTKDAKERSLLVENIVKAWADCGEVEAGSRGAYIDAEHLAILEKFCGCVYKVIYVTPGRARNVLSGNDAKGYVVQKEEKGDNPSAASAEKLEYQYAKMISDIELQLTAQTELALPLAFTMLKEKIVQTVQTVIGDVAVDNTKIYEDGVYAGEVQERTKEIDYSIVKTFFVERMKEDVEGTIYLMSQYTRFIKTSSGFKEYFSLEDMKTMFGESLALVAAIEMSGDNGYYYGTDEIDNKIGSGNGELFFMGDGDDSIDGRNGNDKLYGERGADKLYGSDGNDILIGGSGNDYMQGGKGADLYIHNAGDGDDIISNYDNSEERVKDCLVFGEGICAEDIEVIRKDSDMVLKNTQNGEKITIKDAYSYADGRSYLENIEFADGTVWSKEELERKVLVIVGTDENDILQGYASSYAYNENETFYGGDGDDTVRGNRGNDIIYGESGNDNMYGNEGADILIGGDGNDHMEGGAGADLYIHNVGDGDDTIYNYDTSEERVKDRLVFGEGIYAEDIEVIRKNQDMILENKQNGEKITIANAYSYADGRYYLENVEFADGTVWTKEELERKASVIVGTNENDTLQGYVLTYGYDENETFYGGDGDDTVRGKSGNDIIYGESGTDNIYGNEGADILIGGAGNDYMEGGAGADLYVHNVGDGDDIICNHDSSEDRINDRLVFGEGIHAEDIEVIRKNQDMILENKQNGEKITISYAYGYADGRCYLENVEFADGTVWSKEELQRKTSEIVGTEENDTLQGYVSTYGYDENETFYGGDGDDTVRGKSGNDIIYGESGTDSIYGNEGNDILIGGAGNDYMEGGAGVDVYVHNAGDGDDTIDNYDNSEARKSDRLVFGEGIHAEDIKISREGSNMVLENTQNGEKITIRNAYGYADGRGYLENVEFADGTVWSKAELQRKTSEIVGTEENDTLQGYASTYGYDENETFYGGSGADIIRGNSGNDIIYGENGADNIYGNEGTDILIGGAGNDYMEGGAGADLYIHNAGDGDDIIDNYDNSEARKSDRLVFGEGIHAEDVKISRQGSDMLLQNIKNGENITIRNAYGYTDGRGYLENIEFADGTVWTKEDMQEKVSEITGTEGNDGLRGYASSYGYDENETFYGGGGADTIRGNSGNDIIYGETGADDIYGGSGNDKLYGGTEADRIYGETGNDTLIGGAGNDYMEGGAGADLYLYNVGDGNDTIYNYDTSEDRIKDCLVFGEGIHAEDIKISRQGTDMLLQNIKNGEKITIRNAYSYTDGNGYLENIEFADGTVWSKEDMQEKVSEITGTEGNDTLYGYTIAYGYKEDETFNAGAGNDTVRGNSGNDIIYGEAGNDYLYGEYGNDILVGGIGNDKLDGGVGNDTYIFGKGDGSDCITDSDSTEGNVDVLQIGEEAKKLSFTRVGSNLLISILDTEDTITINNWYNSDANKIETINSADGYTLSHSQVDLLIQSMASFESSSGMSWSEGIKQGSAEIDSITAQIWIKQVG